MRKITDGTRPYRIDKTRDWVRPQDGDVEISLSQLPPELLKALTDTVGFGIQKGLIRGKLPQLVGDLKSRVVCVRHDFESDGRQFTSIDAKSRLSETGGFEIYLNVHGTYPLDEVSGWPESGVHARIAVSNHDFESANIRASLTGTRRTPDHQLIVDDVSLNIEGSQIEVTLSFGAYIGLVLETKLRGRVNQPNYLVFPNQPAKIREMRSLGFDPAIITRLNMDDLIRLQSMITSGQLELGNFDDTLHQINDLLRRIKKV